MNYNNVDNVFNHYKQLLASKHNAKISKYNRIVVHALIKEKKIKLRCMLKECCLFYYCKEYLKRFYKGEECKRRIPKFAVYYKDYLKYFCKAMIRDLNMNKVLMKNMEKAAQVFYYHNYHKGNNVNDKCNNNNNINNVNNNNNVDKKKVNCVNKVFFDRKVVNDIEKERNSNNNNSNNTSNVFKQSNSSNNITSISKITSQNVNDDDSHINDSLMNILLCTLQQQHPNININTTNPSPLSFPSITFKDNINIPHLLKNPLTSSFPSKQKPSFKTTHINTPIPSSTQHPPQYKLTTNKKLKVRQHPNNSGNSITNLITTTTTTTTNNYKQHLPQVVYQYQKYRFKSSDKTPIPPHITSLPNAITLSSPKHSIHLLSVSPPSTQNIHIHHKVCSPPSTSNTNHTSYQRFIFQNNTNIINNNIIRQLSPICAKTKLNNIKINKFTTNKSKPYTRMQSFSLRNSIGIEENVGIVPTNYRIGNNKGSYLYGSVTSLYKRDYKTTMMKVENMKTNNIQEQHSKIYNTSRLNKYN